MHVFRTLPLNYLWNLRFRFRNQFCLDFLRVIARYLLDRVLIKEYSRFLPVYWEFLLARCSQKCMPDHELHYLYKLWFVCKYYMYIYIYISFYRTFRVTRISIFTCNLQQAWISIIVADHMLIQNKPILLIQLFKCFGVIWNVHPME